MRRKHRRLIFPLMTDTPEYVPKREKSRKPINGTHSMCLACPKLRACRRRVQIGMWVMCEIPDAQDMLSVKTTRFKKGDIPWNKSMKGLRMSPETEFKRGNVPATILPVGTVTIRKRKRDNKEIAWIKVAEPNVWKKRAHIVWEEYNEPVPKGLILHRIDGDSRNDDITNLTVLTRAEHIKIHRPEFEKRRREMCDIAQKVRWREYYRLRTDTEQSDGRPTTVQPVT